MKRFMTRTITLALVILLMLGVWGCGKGIKGSSGEPRVAPEDLYRQGYEHYQKGRYTKAIDSFRRMKEQFPLHPLAPNAEIGIANAFFKDESYVEAELTYRDFIDHWPNHELVPYAMYRLGLCHFNEMGEIDRDQTDTLKAVKEFKRLIARFPGHKYAFLAERHLLECRKRLAEREFYVGSFYFTRGNYRAALGRFETILKEYRGVGMDYKVQYFVEESKKGLIRQEAEEKAKREKEEKKARSKEKKVTEKMAANASTAEARPAAPTIEANPSATATADASPAPDKK